MRQLTALFLLLVCATAFGQQKDSAQVSKKELYSKKFDFKNRANDHFMLQFGYDGWVSKPDSINVTGFSRHFNAYVFIDKPFKTDPRWSAAIGAGVGSSNIFFDKMSVRLAANNQQQQVVFKDLADTNHFRKFKLTNVWLEAPIELRFAANPLNTNKSFKVALGAKVGLMVSGYTKGRDFRNSDGQSIYSNKYILKEKDRSFFNSTRLAATFRVAYGIFGIHGAYQILNLFRESSGPPVRPWSIGITISGL
ncbi:MAG TPA: outer membrane beta-barrel protein [Phnomibacter sp.]|nr:outer membrane beta-barrel protein [Phnomibacter sp.]